MSRLKKLLALLFLALPLQAQQPAAQQTIAQNVTMTAIGSGGVVGTSGTSTQNHMIQWWGFGTVSTCSVKLEQSATGTGGWTDLIAATACTSNGASASTAGTPNFVRITLSTLTGGGTLSIRYTGYNSTPSTGGGTEYTEGATDSTITGTAVLWEDAGDTLRPVASGTPLPITCISGCVAGGSFTDNAAFTGGTTAVSPIGALYDTTPPAVTDGSVGAPRMNSSRVLMVDGSGATQPVSGTVTAIQSTAASLKTQIYGFDTAATQAIQTNGSGILSIAQSLGAQSDNQANVALAGNAGGQAPIGVAPFVFDGATWDRWTGAVSATDLDIRDLTATDVVTANLSATDNAVLDAIAASVAAIDTDTSTLLTATAHDAAFGAAGTADAQVRSIQGIAGMTAVTVSATNLDVQIGGSDSLTIGTFPDNEPLNVAQINGVAPLMGNGITGTGSQRVTIASDNTAFAVNATLSAETTKVIGTVNQGTSPWVVGDGAGALNVICDSGCAGSGGTSAVDNSAFTGGTTSVTPMGAIFDATPPTITDGSVGVPRMDADRYLFVDCVVGCAGGATTPADNFTTPTTAGLSASFNMVYDGATWDMLRGTAVDGVLVNLGANNDVTVTSGNITVSDSAGALNVIIDSGTTAVTNAGTFVVQENGAALTALQLIDNPVATLGTATYTEAATNGFIIGAVRRDADTTLVDTTNEVGPLQMDANGRLKVEVFSGETLPVSGTVTVTATNLDVQSGGADIATETTAAAILTSANFAAAFGTAGTADTQVMSVQGIASMTPLLVGDGTGAFNVIVDSGTVTTVSTVTTLSQLGGVALPVEDVAETAAGVGIYAMGVRRDVAASSAGASGDNTMPSFDALGSMWTRTLDPCSGNAKSYLPIDIVTATTTEVTPSLAGASTHYYICSINLVTAAANNVALVDDNTDGCGSPTAGVMGGFGSAAEGWNLAANGGLTLGNGAGSVGRTVTANAVLCLMTSAATQLSGMIVVAAAP